MTVVTDERKSVTLPNAQPGDLFDLQLIAGGKIVLTPVSSTQTSPAKVRVEKRAGFTVGTLDHSIDEAALNEALREFP